MCCFKYNKMSGSFMGVSVFARTVSNPFPFRPLFCSEKRLQVTELELQLQLFILSEK